MGANSTVSYYGTDYNPYTKDYITDKRRGGRGLTFPLGAEKKTGGFLSANSGMRRVSQALHQLLRTERGERVMLPKFGCNLKKFMFQPLDALTFNQIKEEVLYSCYNYLQGATVSKLSVLQGNEIGRFGEHSIHIILVLQMQDEMHTVFTEEVVVQ